jgi:glutamine amidotransferase
MGNLGSLINMFKRIGVKASIESDPERIRKAEKIVLPGVGAFDSAMSSINKVPGMIETLNHKALVEKIPILGVCLGMQLFTRCSEEGNLPGLGWIPASTLRFPKHQGLKVPHMGWNIARSNSDSKLMLNVIDESRYYFVHSYYVHVEDQTNSLMKTNYGIEFDSAIGKENIYGVQFHPEKSHRYGMQILQNFAKL